MELILLAAIIAVTIYGISKPKAGDLSPSVRR
jgi:hypothetical protein